MLRLIAFIILIVFIYFYLRYLMRFLGLTQRKPREKKSNMHVNPNGKSKEDGKFKGGEYIDYEEVDKN